MTTLTLWLTFVTLLVVGLYILHRGGVRAGRLRDEAARAERELVDLWRRRGASDARLEAARAEFTRINADTHASEKDRLRRKIALWKRVRAQEEP